MPTLIATRTRPYVDPHPASALQATAISQRDAMFAERNRAIKRLASENKDTNPSEFYWTMVYDTQHAPEVTGRARLLESGIIPVPPQELVTDPELHDELWTIIEALSTCGIYLFNTGHLTDRDLYARLYFRILDEPTRLMPPAAEAAEFIDCFHPYDLAHPLASSLTPTDPTVPRQSTLPYERGPIYSVLGCTNSRDCHLPRPATP